MFTLNLNISFGADPAHFPDMELYKKPYTVNSGWIWITLYQDKNGLVRAIECSGDYPEGAQYCREYFDSGGNVNRILWDLGQLDEEYFGYALFQEGKRVKTSSRLSQPDYSDGKCTYKIRENVFNREGLFLSVNEVWQYMKKCHEINGYIYLDWIDSSDYSEIEDGDQVMVCQPEVAVHQKADNQSAIIDTLSMWDTQILSTSSNYNGEYFQVKYTKKGKKKSGWISNEYLKKIDPERISAGRFQPPLPGYWTRINALDVSLRESPSTQSPRLALLNIDNQLEVTAAGKTETISPWGSFPWYQVRYVKTWDSENNPEYVTGWVFGAFLEPIFVENKK